MLSITLQSSFNREGKSLIKGIYHDFFSKPADYAIKIKDLIIKGKAGGTPSSTVAQYYNGDIPFLSISDMTKQGKYVSYTEKHISKSGIENSSAWIVPHIYFKDYSNERIYYPDKALRKKITKTLDFYETMVEIERKMLSAMQKQKAFLLQSMFI